MGRTRYVVDTDKIYLSKNNQYYKIIEELPAVKYNKQTKRVVRIKFIDTGYTTDIRLQYALSGNARDVYAPSIYGIACCGDYEKYEYHNKKLYSIWLNIIHKCYNPKYSTYKYYGGAGIKVCDDWLCYEYFLRDIKEIPNFNEYIHHQKYYRFCVNELQAYIPKNKRVFSKETCIFKRYNP